MFRSICCSGSFSYGSISVDHCLLWQNYLQYSEIDISHGGVGAKAFSTCSSHLIVVVLFYGSASITYLQPKTNQSEGIGKLLSLFYTILTPTLNPIICTLRNKDITVSLRKLQTKLVAWGKYLKLQNVFVYRFAWKVYLPLFLCYCYR
jgi:hypothetical protein